METILWIFFSILNSIGLFVLLHYNGYLTDEQLTPHVGVVRSFTTHSRPYH